MNVREGFSTGLLGHAGYILKDGTHCEDTFELYENFWFSFCRK